MREGETVPAFALICGSSLCQNCPHLLWDYQASENQLKVLLKDSLP